MSRDTLNSESVHFRMNGVVPPATRQPQTESAAQRVGTIFKDGGAYGIVARVEEPFGNLDTSFIESDFRSIGIALGDSFQLRCRNKTFDVVSGRTFRDVPRGEWVALASTGGAVKMGRSFANAAELSGCDAGDSLFVSKPLPK
jgi:S-adenosylmethionine hydrolase